MNTQSSQFSRIALIILVSLYVLTIAGFSYANWSADPQSTEWWMVVVNFVVLSIPLVLLYGSIYVLLIAWRERTSLGQINPRLEKIIYWAPRIAAITIIIFVGLFSLDVFEEEASPFELLSGFLIHNIPSIVMLLLLIFAWKRPAVGFVAFLVVAILFALFFVRNLEMLPNLLLFVFPLLLIAGLFYADWKWLQPPDQAVTE